MKDFALQTLRAPLYVNFLPNGSAVSVIDDHYIILVSNLPLHLSHFDS